jgi:hypothetical protein
LMDKVNFDHSLANQSGKNQFLRSFYEEILHLS